MPQKIYTTNPITFVHGGKTLQCEVRLKYLSSVTLTPKTNYLEYKIVIWEVGNGSFTKSAVVKVTGTAANDDHDFQDSEVSTVPVKTINLNVEDSLTASATLGSWNFTENGVTDSYKVEIKVDVRYWCEFGRNALYVKSGTTGLPDKLGTITLYKNSTATSTDYITKATKSRMIISKKKEVTSGP